MVLISLLVLKKHMNVDRLNCNWFTGHLPYVEYTRWVPQCLWFSKIDFIVGSFASRTAGVGSPHL